MGVHTAQPERQAEMGLADIVDRSSRSRRVQDFGVKLGRSLMSITVIVRSTTT